jgi:hypothetical protein
MKTPVNYTRRKSVTATNEQLVNDVIGSALKTYYSDIESRDVPPQFLALLNRLDEEASTSKD